MDPFIHPVKILIADDHPLVRVGVREALDSRGGFQIVGEAADGRILLELGQKFRPDIILMDLDMPYGTPRGLIQQLQVLTPRSRILVLSEHFGHELLTSIRDLNIAGFILKSDSTELLHQALRIVHQGDQWFNRSVSERFSELARTAEQSTIAAFTSREDEVFELMRRGLDNQAIAIEMQLSRQTVRRYATIIYEKLGVKNRVQAIILGEKREPD